MDTTLAQMMDPQWWTGTRLVGVVVFSIILLAVGRGIWRDER